MILWGRGQSGCALLGSSLVGGSDIKQKHRCRAAPRRRCFAGKAQCVSGRWPRLGWVLMEGRHCLLLSSPVLQKRRFELRCLGKAGSGLAHHGEEDLAAGGACFPQLSFRSLAGPPVPKRLGPGWRGGSLPGASVTGPSS